jgi:hypothetical protein
MAVYFEAAERIFHLTLSVPCLSQQGVSQFQQSCAASCSVLFCMTLDELLRGLRMTVVVLKINFVLDANFINLSTEVFFGLVFNF